MFATFSYALSEADDELELILFRVANFFVRWVDECPMDFFYENNLLPSFMDWWSCVAPQYNPGEDVQAQISHCMKMLEKGRREVVRFEVEQRVIKGKIEHYLIEVVPLALGQQRTIGNMESLLKIDPKELAQEIFVKDYHLLARIPQREFLFQRWTSSDKMENAPNIVFAMQQLNAVSHWFASQVLKATKPQEQCSCIMRIIDVASFSLELGDFHSLINIISTLNTAAMSKLKNAWTLVPQSYLNRWEDMSVLMNPLGNWKMYRDSISIRNNGFIPFLGVVLNDMLMIDQGNATFLPDGNVNISKLDLIANTMEQFNKFKSTPCTLTTRPELKFIHQLKDTTNDDELYRLAQLRVLSQNCASKKSCIVKARIIFDVDTIIQLSPNAEGKVLFLTLQQESMVKRGKKSSTDKKESTRALCVEQTACWSSVLSQEGSTTAQLELDVTLTQDTKTLEFKRKDVILTLRKQMPGKSPGIAKATLNLAEFADHQTDVRKTIAMQSKSSIPPLMDVRY